MYCLMKSSVFIALLFTFLAAFLFSNLKAQDAPFKRGDVNADGLFDISDPINSLGHQFTGLPDSLDCVDAADSNDDGLLDVSDPIHSLSFQFLGTQPPPEPFNLCGRDPTPDTLECLKFDPCEIRPPSVPAVNEVTSPTSDLTATITGNSEPGLTIEIARRFELVGTTTVNPEGQFSIPVVLEPNTTSQFFITAMNEVGDKSPSIPLQVTQDSQPPALFIDFPEQTALVSTATTTIAGRVSDLLSGFMGLTVTVNGQQANVDEGIGTNGTFERTEVPLNIGDNSFTVVATDAVGNQQTKQYQITRIIPSGPRLEIISGNNQSEMMRTILNDPLLVRLSEENGTPVADTEVLFEVKRSDGTLYTSPDGPGVRTIRITTNENGEAAVFYRLGTDAGCGNNRVKVSFEESELYFCASATPAPPNQINIGSNANYRGEVGGPAPELLRVWVSDGCNGIAGIPVTFTVTHGDGKIIGKSSATVETSSTGHAEVPFTIGITPGNNLVTANFEGNETNSATFTIFGIERDESILTSFSGLVLDNSYQPIRGVQCFLTIAGEETLDTETNIHGQFEFIGLSSSGPAHLFVKGSTGNQLGGEGGIAVPFGSFPSLPYDVRIIANAENSLPSPILLPRLDPDNAKVYDGNETVELTVKGIDGLKMTIEAGTKVTLPEEGIVVDGTNDNSTILTLNQVHHDDIPMAMPDGVAPPFAWTLQPAGATFDPPIKISYPNMSGLAPGAIAYFLSFNHDTEKFEIVSSGQVSEDGSMIQSDPGSGLTLAGWGCNCPPYAVTGSCRKCPPVGECELVDPECPPGNEGDCPNANECFPPCPQSFRRRDADGNCQLYVDFSRDGDAGYLDKLGIVGSTLAKTLSVEPLFAVRKNLALGAYGDSSAKTRIANAHRHIWWQCNLTRGMGADVARCWGHAHENNVNQERSPCMGLDSNFLPENAPCNEDQLLDFWNNKTGREAALDPTYSNVSCGDLALDIALGDNPDYEAGLFLNSELKKKIECQVPQPPVDDDCTQPFIKGLIDCPTLHVTPEEIILDVGESLQLEVLLENCGGSRVDRTSIEDGGSYLLWDFAAEIDDQGVITGLEPGTAELLISAETDDGTAGAFLELFVRVRGPGDLDGDQMLDQLEIDFGLDPTNPADALGDLDQDGIYNIEELRLGTLPNNPDTDGDGGLDGDEQYILGTDPLNPDLVLSMFQLSVNGQTVTVNGDGSFTIPNISAPDAFGAGGPGSIPDFLSDDPVRVIGTGVLNGTTYYVYSEPFYLRSQETFIVDQLTLSDTLPPIPVSLSVEAAQPVLAPGQTTQLMAIGNLANGETVDLTSREKFTIYRTSNTDIVTVDEFGVVTAGNEGRAFVTASNEGVTAVEQIIVSASETREVTVTGVVLLPDGTPAEMVQVASLFGTDIFTDANGEFSIHLSVPLGAVVTIIFELETNQGDLLAQSIELPDEEIIDGGIINLGDTTLRAIQTIDFVASKIFTLNGSVNSLQVGHMDEDGILDLVLCVESTPEPVVLFGEGDGAFKSPGLLPQGSGGDALQLMLLNGDELLDALVLDSSAEEIQIFLGTNQGTYVEGDRIELGLEASHMELADADNDGDLDVFTFSINPGGFQVLLNQGDGTFADPVDYTVLFPGGIAIGDIDGNGTADVLISNSFNSTVSIYKGSEEGTYVQSGSFPASFFATGMAIGDVDGNGDLDVAIASQVSADIAIHLGDGEGSFGAAQVFDSTLPNSKMAFVDLVGSSDLDLILIQPGAHGPKIAEGQGDGMFSVPVLHTTVLGTADISWGDFNGDGKRDFVTANSSGNNLSVFLAGDSDEFEEARMIPSSSLPLDVIATDLDLDGIVDFISINPSDETIGVHLGLGSGDFKSPISTPLGLEPNAFVVEDFDGDDFPDLAVSQFVSGGIQILRGLGNGSFTSTETLPTATFLVDLVAEDFDGDNVLDLAVAFAGKSTIEIFTGNGDGTFSDGIELPTASSSGAISVGELTGDGVFDIVLARSATDSIAILAGDGNSNFARVSSLDTPSLPTHILVEDFDGDGLDDIVSLNQANATFDVYLNGGNSSFIRSHSATVGRDPSSIIAKDIDLDGRLDIITTDVEGGSVSISIGRGEGRFLLPVQFGAGIQPINLDIEDLNSDGNPDLIIANFGSATFSILFASP